MKSLFFNILLLLSLGTAITLHAQTNVATYHPGTTAEGITYFLPKTHLHIIVRAERNSYVPGDYSQYAERFLEEKNVEQQAADTWRITAIEIVPYGVADRTRAYTIALNPKTSAPLVRLSPDGCLLAVNADATPLPSLERASWHHVAKTQPLVRDHKTQAMIRAGSLSAKAELAAQEIYDIRENRSLLAKGQADFNPKDGAQLSAMLQQLSLQEEALTQLFLGTKRTETHIFTFDFLPTANVVRQPIFRFSQHLGLVDADDLAGDPIFISVEDLKTLPEEEVVTKSDKKERNDLRYCNPSNARITVANSAGVLTELITPIAQFGRIEHLGGELFNKKFSTRVTLSSVTGSVEKIDLEIAQQ